VARRGRLSWSWGRAGRAVARGWKLCRIAGLLGQLRDRGDLVMVGSRSVGLGVISTDVRYIRRGRVT
jgi:hypothetical protein